MRTAILAFFLLLASAYQLHADTYTLGTMMDMDTPSGSAVVPLAREAFSRLGHQADISFIPSERLLQMTSQGLLDGDILRIYPIEQEHPNLVRVPEPILSSDLCLYTLDPDIRVAGWEDLAPLEVIIRAHMEFTKPLYKVVPEHNIYSTSTYDNMFRMLLQGRGDVVLIHEFEAATVLNKPEFKDCGIIRLDHPLATHTGHIYLNARHANLVARLDKAIKDMKRDGAYMHILEKALNPTPLSRISY